MPNKENYTPFISVAFGLTITILLVFQIYLGQESERIEDQERADHLSAVEEGHNLYRDNCATCHGENGEGGVGPALNSRTLLQSSSNEVFFNLTRTGIPGTTMPAWGQVFGGPFTDEQIVQITTFIRDWEATAPELTTVVDVPNPIRGAAIFARACFVCHGQDGVGTDIAPALNDSARLNRFDDAWYRNTIIRGRPAKGMPTWGTVLSPDQINDVVALLAAWREGEAVLDETPLEIYLSNAIFSIRDFDQADAEFYLNLALTKADDAQSQEIQEIIDLVQENQLFVAQDRLAVLLPPIEMGQAMFTSYCSACHGDDGTGGSGPNLHNIGFIESHTDDELIQFLMDGRDGTAMQGFAGTLADEELSNIILLLRSWQ